MKPQLQKPTGAFVGASWVALLIGGVTYLTNGMAFVGDALFAGSTGRSMSPTGYQSLISSLRKKVLSLDSDTVIFPGHGPATTVGEEQKHNPFFIR